MKRIVLACLVLVCFRTALAEKGYYGPPRPLPPAPPLPAQAPVQRPDGRLHGLQSGANVVMPNLTPRTVARDYEIYPGKRAPHIELAEEVERAKDVIRQAGRTVATGPGHSPRACATAL